MIVSKRFRRKGKYYVSIRTKGRFLKIVKWTQKKKILRSRLQLTEDQKEILKKEIRRKKVSSVEFKPISKISKRFTRGRDLLSRKTRIIEYRLKRPLARKRGVLEIKWEFRAKGEKATATGRSNKMLLTNPYIKSMTKNNGMQTARNQSLQRAMSQINFSPEDFNPLETTFIYWIAVDKIPKSLKSRFFTDKGDIDLNAFA